MTADNMYTSGRYLECNQTWHAEDSRWKSEQVVKLLEKHGLWPQTIGEVGTGAGVVLSELAQRVELRHTRFFGYDISPQAIALAKQREPPNVRFEHADPLVDDALRFDLLLALDVLEHVPDYMGFLRGCQAKAEYKIYHIPLDLHVSSVLRNSFVQSRYKIGHLHYFVADSALATLEDTGHEVVDYVYTSGAIEGFGDHPSFKRAVANVPRWLVAQVSVPLAARLFGGFSLLVLCR